MKIVIATGIYPPEIGGPALYARGVKEALEKEGHETALVIFGSMRHFPAGVRHLLYLLKLFRAAGSADAILAFDTASVGVPAACVGTLRRIPVVIRIGGDFVWEQYVERTGEMVPLPDFYRVKKHLSLKEQAAFYLIRWMLHHAHLAFNSRWLIDIWKEPYKLDEARCSVVENVIHERRAGSEDREPTVLVFGRTLRLKNSASFQSAFKRANVPDLKLEILTQPLAPDELMQRISKSYAAAVPSISDVAPNSILDAIACSTPFILTKHSGYAKRFRDFGIIVDPLDEEDMANAIKKIADPKMYAELSERIHSYNEHRAYDDVAKDMLDIVNASAHAR